MRYFVIQSVGNSTNRSQIRKLRIQGFDLWICEPISYREHLREKIEIYRKSAKQQHRWDCFFAIL